MPEKRRPPVFQDFQRPAVYLTGMALRRGFLTGPAGTPEEERLQALIVGMEEEADSSPADLRGSAARFFRRLWAR